MSRRRPLSFDPIAEASANWAQAGWDDAEPGMAFVTSIMRVQQILLGRADEILGEFNLTFARFEVLMLLRFSRAGQLPLGKIGERLQVHPASVTNVIDRLQGDGLVAREPHPTDGRTTLAVLTQSGRRVCGRAAAALNDRLFTDVGLKNDDSSNVVSLLADLRHRAGDFNTSPDVD